MAGKVNWTLRSWDDLKEAADYISKDSPNYAKAFVDDIRNAAQSLAYFSERGRIVPDQLIL